MGNVAGPFIPPSLPPRRPVEESVIRQLKNVIAELERGRRLVVHEKMLTWSVDPEHGDAFTANLRFSPETKR